MDPDDFLSAYKWIIQEHDTHSSEKYSSSIDQCCEVSECKESKERNRELPLDKNNQKSCNKTNTNTGILWDFLHTNERKNKNEHESNILASFEHQYTRAKKQAQTFLSILFRKNVNHSNQNNERESQSYDILSPFPFWNLLRPRVAEHNSNSDVRQSNLNGSADTPNSWPVYKSRNFYSLMIPCIGSFNLGNGGLRIQVSDSIFSYGFPITWNTKKDDSSGEPNKCPPKN